MPAAHPLSDDHRAIIEMSLAVAGLLKTNPAKVNSMLEGTDVTTVSVERMVGLLRYTARAKATLPAWTPYLERVTAELVARKLEPATVLKGIA